MTKTRSAWCLALLVSSAACSTAARHGSEIAVHPKFWEPVELELSFRAAADLGCAKSDVALTLIRRQGKIPTVVGASGCGRSAVYSRQLRRHHGRFTDANSVWSLDSLSADQPVIRTVSAP